MVVHLLYAECLRGAYNGDYVYGIHAETICSKLVDLYTSRVTDLLRLSNFHWEFGLRKIQNRDRSPLP